MKKRIFVIGLILAVFACGFIPVTKSDSFKIGANYYNVYRVVTSPGNWLHWQPDLRKVSNPSDIKIDSSKYGFRIVAPSLLLELQNTGLGSFEVTERRDGKKDNLTLIVTPEEKSNNTLCSVFSKTNMLGYLTGLLSTRHKRLPFAGLKDYMESTRLYYGFMIRKQLTQEKLIAVKKGTFLNRTIYQQGAEKLDELNEFIRNNKLKVITPLQVQYVAATEDSSQVMLGLAVDKKVTTNKIEYMTMPRGRVLVGDYNGAYKGKEKLYSAMRRYMRDNYIHPLIQPFERFDNNKLPASDSSVVNMQLIIPYM